MASLWADILQSPLRAVMGFFGGAVDGAVGKVDQTERFSDGAVAQSAPEEKSRAGRFLSDHAGWRGGKETGERFGKWGFAAGAGVMTAHFLFTAMLPAIGFAVWPVIGSCLLVGAAAYGASLLGKPLGKYAGMVAGAAVGMVGGAVVGAANAVFKRGYYKDVASPQAESAESSLTPPAEPTVASPDVPVQARGVAPEVAPAATYAPPAPSGGFVERLQQERQAPRQRAVG